MTLVAMAQSWNLIGGLGGQFSVANHAFVGVGAYTVAMLLLKTGTPVGVAILASGALSVVVAAIASVPLFRLRGVYFSVGSLAVALAIQAWMIDWSYTGASTGLNLPIAQIPNSNALYRIATVLAVGATLCVYLMLRSQFGLRLMAVRDNEDAATGLGVHGFTIKAAAFMFSAFIVGVAGALIALDQISIEPTTMFGISFTVNMIVMAIIGGLGTTLGPVIGVLVVYVGIQQQLQSSPSLSGILTGALLIVVIRFAPGGLLDIAARARAFAMRTWRRLRASDPLPRHI
jgi:branched-chain amino acid transport system permease protein